MSIRSLRTRLTAALMATAAVVGVAGVVSTAPAQARTATTYVYSAAMNKTIPVQVLRAANRSESAPTLYLLDGLRAPDNDNGWLINTDVVRYFSDKNVNVVIPFGGGGTFYQDWERRDPKLGVVKWDTFLTRELPGVLKSRFGSDGVRNAVAGLSMSGTSALILAAEHPRMFQGVASFSGYPTSSEPGYAQGIGVAVSQMGGDATNMWGVWPGGQWLAKDPSLNVAKLRGKRVYVSSALGGSPINPVTDPVKFSQFVPLETAAGVATQQYVAALRLNGVTAVSNISGEGTHWWDQWQDRLKQAWVTTLAPALGL